MVNVNQMDGRETTSSVKGKRNNNWIANLLTWWLADSRHSPLEIDFQWIEEDWEMIQSCFVLSSLKIIESILSSCTNSRPLDNNSLAFLASSQFKKWKSWKRKVNANRETSWKEIRWRRPRHNDTVQDWSCQATANLRIRWRIASKVNNKQTTTN